MEWYETQIIGVAVGGLLGFGANFLLKYFDKKKLKESLEAGIKSEVKFLKHVADRGVVDFTLYKDEIIKNRKVKTLYEYTGDFTFYFLDKNLDKIGILGEDLLTPLIELRQMVTTLSAGLRITRDTAHKARENNSYLSTHEVQLTQAIATFTHIKELCNKVLSV